MGDSDKGNRRLSTLRGTPRPGFWHASTLVADSTPCARQELHGIPSDQHRKCLRLGSTALAIRRRARGRAGYVDVALAVGAEKLYHPRPDKQLPSPPWAAR